MPGSARRSLAAERASRAAAVQWRSSRSRPSPVPRSWIGRAMIPRAIRAFGQRPLNQLRMAPMPRRASRLCWPVDAEEFFRLEIGSDQWSVSASSAHRSCKERTDAPLLLQYHGRPFPESRAGYRGRLADRAPARHGKRPSDWRGILPGMEFNEPTQTWTVIVTDESGDEVLTVPLSGARRARRQAHSTWEAALPNSKQASAGAPCCG